MPTPQAPIDLTAITSEPVTMLGELYEVKKDKKAYVHVKFNVKNVATAAGEIWYFTNEKEDTVTNIGNTGLKPAGVPMAAIPNVSTDCYGWIQVRGHNATCCAEGGAVAAGAAVMATALAAGNGIIAQTAGRLIVGHNAVAIAADGNAATYLYLTLQ